MSEAENLPEAAELVGRLEKVYEEYLAAGQKAQNRKQGFADLFSGWFQPPGYSPSVPEDDQFVTEVQSVVSKLAEQLADAPADIQSLHALRALQIMLQAAGCSASQSLYLCAVLDYGLPLAACLSAENKAQLCRQMKSQEDPRRYLPSQRALYEALKDR